MPVSAIPRLTASLATRRRGLAAAGLAIVAALSLVSLSRPDLARAAAEGVAHGVHDLKTVAAMIADRSPGARAKGALASLKHKKKPAVHERALAKVRRPVPPVSPLLGLIGTPPVAPVTIPPAMPLYAMLNGPPLAIVPFELVPGGPSSPPNGLIPGGPGGGGGIIVPPIVTTATPVTPVTPGVPEPTSWAMMLVGFAFMARAIRRDRRAGFQPAPR
jgi:hypothetical protein